MRTRFDKKTGIYALYLERGEPLNSSIESFAASHDIGAAMVHAIGAVENPVLGYYHLDTRVYEWHEYSGIFELNMSGANITLKDGKPFLHAHPTIAGPDHVAHMGHLQGATVGVVVECFLTPLGEPIEREQNNALGLACWELDL